MAVLTRLRVAALVAALALAGAACHDLDPTPPANHQVWHVDDMPQSVQTGTVWDKYVSSHDGNTWYYLLIVNGERGFVGWILANRAPEFASCARGDIWHRFARNCN